MPPALPAGALIRNRYRLSSTLRIGHAVAVYRAQDVETGRAVVVKVFHQVGRNDWGRIQSFQRPSLSRAPRPELPAAFVAVHECDLTDDGQLFLVTELVEGPSIAELLSRTPPPALTRAIELAMRIGEALEATLNLGLLDLRVAPGDIIVVDDGDRVKLLGSEALIVQRLSLGDQLAAAEAAERDPRYASPEELAGLPATERSVTYRFGVLLHELLNGRPPFEGTTPAEVRDRQLRPRPKRLPGRYRALPTSLDRLVSRMLDPEPSARPADLTSILNELWDTTCRLRSESPATRSHAAISSASAAPEPRGRRSWTHRGAFAGLPILVVGGTFLAWPYLVVGPSAPTSAPASVQSAPSVPTSLPASVQSAVDVPPPSAPVPAALPLVLPPSDPGTSRGRVSTQVLYPPVPVPLPPPAAEQPPREATVDGGGSRARGGNSASVAPGVAPLESPQAPAAAKAPGPAVAPVREAPSPGRPAEAPPPRRASVPVQPEPTSARGAPSAPLAQPDTAVAPPPARPTEPRAGNSRGMDPGAIIDWLVQERPRIAE